MCIRTVRASQHCTGPLSHVGVGSGRIGERIGGRSCGLGTGAGPGAGAGTANTMELETREANAMSLSDIAVMENTLVTSSKLCFVVVCLAVCLYIFACRSPRMFVVNLPVTLPADLLAG